MVETDWMVEELMESADVVEQASASSSSSIKSTTVREILEMGEEVVELRAHLLAES